MNFNCYQLNMQINQVDLGADNNILKWTLYTFSHHWSILYYYVFIYFIAVYYIVTHEISPLNFYYRYLLEQHLHTHQKQITTKRYHCHFKNCIFSGRSDAELRDHYYTHSDEKSFECNYSGCDYRGKMKKYLVRYVI